MKNAIDLKMFSTEARALIAGAQALADTKHHASVDPIHLLAYALEHHTEVSEMFQEAGINSSTLVSKTNIALDKQKKASSGESSLSSETIALIARLEKNHASKKKDVASSSSEETISVEEIIDALVNLERGTVHLVFKSCEVSKDKLKPAKTPNFIIDLLANAKQGKFDPVVGRDKEVRRLFQILGRRTKNNAILVGETGVGKTAICNALATRIVANDAPESLTTANVLELRLASVLSGAKGRAEADERLKKTLFGLASNTILVVANLETLFTGQGATSDILKNEMARGNIRLLASTTPDGIKKIADKDPSLMTSFSQVFVDPTTPEMAKEVLRSVVPKYEAHHSVVIGENAIAGSVRLAKRYLQDRALPGSAIDLLDEAASRKRLEMESLPNHIDEVVRRLASLRLQRATYCDAKSGELKGALGSDPATVKMLGKLNEEIFRLESDLTVMQGNMSDKASAEITIAELRKECADVAGKLVMAEVESGDVKQVEALRGELHSLKARLGEAQAAVKNVAVDVADETNNVVSDEHCAMVLEDWRGIKASKMLESETDKLRNLEDAFRERIVGQDEAVSAVSQAIRRARLGLRDPRRPVGSFLFLGSSGVGKTLIAKALAEQIYGSSEAMLRLDMSEYREAHQAQKLIGSPPGYVDSSSGGLLTSFIQKQPNSLVLLDEIEKACGQGGAGGAVSDLLLGILDDARLTDGRGQTANFNEAIVVMTSNIGTGRLLAADPKEFDTEEGRKRLSDALLHEDLANYLRPELINRIDNIIVFRPLLKDTLMKVADIELRALDKLLEHREMKIKVSDAGKRALVDDEFNASFGARPLKRSITKNISTRLTDELMSGNYNSGDTIAVDYVDGKFTFQKARVQL